MRYVRTFRLQAAHFNSEMSYKVAWAIVDGRAAGIGLERVDAGSVLFALTDTHGHNFKIEVTIKGVLMANGSRPWLIDDELLAKIVMEWDNCNLSVHPNFLDKKARATTECMAATLLLKLIKAFEHAHVNVECVRVYETDDIYAEAR